jgi:ribosome maturation factor RimP
LLISDCIILIAAFTFFNPQSKIRNPKYSILNLYLTIHKHNNLQIQNLFLHLSPIRGVMDTWGTKVPYFIIIHQTMIDKVKIENLVKEFIGGTELFLVTVKVNSAGKITVLADKKEGITIDECVSISRFIEKNLNRDEEDYELMVSSPGLDMPFMVKEQYFKSEGKNVEVICTEGTKFSGLLKNVTDGGFEIETEVKVKGQTKEIKELSFNYDQVKFTRKVVSFK